MYNTKQDQRLVWVAEDHGTKQNAQPTTNYGYTAIKSGILPKCVQLQQPLLLAKPGANSVHIDHQHAIH